MNALPKARTRRLARSGASIRAAAGMVLSRPRACLVPHPPHPLTMGNRPHGDKTGRAKGRAAGFLGWRVYGVCEKPVEIAVTTTVCHVAVRVPHPRVVSIYPRVAMFYPRVCFCTFAPVPLSISFISLRKERDREGERAKTSIHGFLKCNKMYPRVCSAIHGFSVDAFLSRTQYWRGFEPCFVPIHASTGRNAYTPQESGSQ